MDKVTENPFKNRVAGLAKGRGNSSLMAVTAIFVTLYLTSNIMAVKVISIFRLFYFDAGTITFPFAYMLGDVLTEIWGYRMARKIIFLTLLCNILLVVFTMIGVWLPSPDYLAETAEAYGHIFTYVPRIVPCLPCRLSGRRAFERMADGQDKSLDQRQMAMGQDHSLS